MFIGQTFWHLPLTVRRYRRQTLATMIEMSWGRGALIVDGGTISVLLILGMAVGASLGIEALATLNTLGFGALSGLGLIMQDVGDDKHALDAYRKAVEVYPRLKGMEEKIKTLKEKVEGRDL